MKGGPVLAAALLLAHPAGAQDRPGFDTPPPAALPDISSWESDGASLDLEEPERTLEYELLVSPDRQGVWAVTRYRTRHAAPDVAPRGAGDERLQWNDGKSFRRWVCRPQPGGGCRWRELEEGSEAYQAELTPVLLIWRMHRRLMWARARSFLPHED